MSRYTNLAHGTHVLDLAAGESPETGGGTLLAVQLAPGTMLDTSGRRLEMFLVMGLRWMAHRALALDRDLVVNLSLGSLAGPGDATNFVASAIATEIARFTQLSGQRHGPGRGRRMRVVIAYGNSWRANLVADFALEAGAARAVDWRILPDGCSSSYLELRVPKGAQAVRVTLAPPNGAGALAWTIGAPGPAPVLSGPGGQPIARILPLPQEPDAEAVLLAVALSASLLPGQGDLAPAGAWTVTVTATQAGCAVTMRVQRNDTPVGYRLYGRQSYLADAGLGARDAETRDYSCPERAPGAASALTRQGTANAYAGLADVAADAASGVYYVGAARPDPGALGWAAGAAGAPVPSPYSAEGVPGGAKALQLHSDGPTLADMGDDGRFLAGRRASPVGSGARSLRLSGTSIAAGTVTRRVAAVLAAGPGPGAELERVLGAAPAAVRDTRLGYGTIR